MYQLGMGLADVMISKDKSEWEEILFYYRALGFSEDKAFMEALKEQGRQMLKDGAAGAITGVAAAGGRLALGQISEGIQNHRNYREAVQNGNEYYALIYGKEARVFLRKIRFFSFFIGFPWKAERTVRWFMPDGSEDKFT